MHPVHWLPSNIVAIDRVKLRDRQRVRAKPGFNGITRLVIGLDKPIAIPRIGIGRPGLQRVATYSRHFLRDRIGVFRLILLVFPIDHAPLGMVGKGKREIMRTGVIVERACFGFGKGCCSNIIQACARFDSSCRNRSRPLQDPRHPDSQGGRYGAWFRCKAVRQLHRQCARP